MKLFLVVCALFGCVLAQTEEQNGTKFLEEYDETVAVLFNDNVKAAWAYYTNLTKHNENIMVSLNILGGGCVSFVPKNSFFIL